MVVKRVLAAAVGALALGLAACSGSSNGPPPPFLVYPRASPSPVATIKPGASPTPSPFATATGTPTPTPSATGSAPVTASPNPGGNASPSPTPTPVATAAPAITGSLTAIVVCVEQQTTCASDLNPNATSGEEAAVLVKGVTGTLSYANAGGAAVATLEAQVYSTSGGSTEYEVFYTSATSSPTTDTLTISDSGSHSSLTIPVSIVNVGSDTGPDAFELATTSGTVCPGNQVTFGAQQQGNAAIALSETNSNLIAIGPNIMGTFALNILTAGSEVVTASAGSSSVIYPVNIPVKGFTPSC